MNACSSLSLIQIQDLLEAKRGSIHAQLDGILSVEYEPDCSCDFKGRSAYSYLGQLSKKGLLPSPYLDRETALNRIKKAEQMGPPSEIKTNTACENYRWHRSSYSQQSMLTGLEKLKDGKGLCLHCISRGNPVYSEKPCSIEH